MVKQCVFIADAVIEPKKKHRVSKTKRGRSWYHTPLFGGENNWGVFLNMARVVSQTRVARVLLAGSLERMLVASSRKNDFHFSVTRLMTSPPTSNFKYHRVRRHVHWNWTDTGSQIFHEMLNRTSHNVSRNIYIEHVSSLKVTCIIFFFDSCHFRDNYLQVVQMRCRWR